ncbi:MAG: DUF943 family protein [Bacteroidales bacterium]
MKRKFGLLLIAVLTYIFWQGISYVYRYFQPMEVVDIIKSNEGFYDYIIVKNPPLNEHDFIRWWQENKAGIQVRYAIPSTRDESGSFTIGVWDIGEGYETDKSGEYKPVFPYLEKYDQTCIMEIVGEERCVEKNNRYANVGRAISGWYSIEFSSGNEYIQNDKGEFVKRKKPER